MAALAAFASFFGLVRSAAALDLMTSGIWRVSGQDDDGVYWSGNLVFETADLTAQGYDLQGYFDWYSEGSYRGRELFLGKLSLNRGLHLVGYAVTNPDGIVYAEYLAELSADGATIVGIWQSVPEGPVGLPGFWRAARGMPPLELLQPFGVKFESLVGEVYILQDSIDLIQWNDIETITGDGTTVERRFETGGYTKRFFRLRAGE